MWIPGIGRNAMIGSVVIFRFLGFGAAIPTGSLGQKREGYESH